MGLKFCERFGLGNHHEDDGSDDESASDDEEKSANSEEGKEEVAQRIDKILRRPIRTRRTIRRCFHEYADDEDDNGYLCITADQAQEMLPELAEALKLPEWVFNGQSLLFERFDFDGKGMLTERECKKMYLVVLQQRRKQIAGRRTKVKVPNSTIQKSGYTVLRELGKGGQGTMYLCSKRWSWRQYCIKFYSKSEATSAGIEELIDEYTLMKALSSKYVAKTYEVFQDQSFYYLVNEPYFGGDLTKLGKRAYDEGVSMSEDWWRNIFRQCVDGVIYLHQQAIMHCDIKEPNIMIADGSSYGKPRPVLIDFGLSVVFGAEKHAICGTPGYIPPETWRESTWYPNGDMFSLGVTMFQLLCGRVPQVGVLGVLQSRDIAQCVKAAERKPLPWEIFPRDMPELRNLIEQMTARSRHDRLRPSGVRDHDWFSSSSDADLPEKSLSGLIGKAAEQEAEEFLVHQLAEANNMDELRALNQHFVAEDPNATGAVECETALQLLRPRKAHPNAISAYARAILGDGCVGTDPFPYARLMHRVLELKANYDDQHLHDVFNEFDTDSDGALSREQVKVLLHGDGFELPYAEIEAVIAQMATTRDGKVVFDEFRRVVVQDGRIARRAGAERGQSVGQRV